MAAQHTPGPWKASPSGDGYRITRNDVFVVGHSIGEVRPSQAADEDACEANARLIAAAPDMLAALKGVLGIARAATLHSGGEHNRDRVAAAEAAVAKAEGRS